MRRRWLNILKVFYYKIKHRSSHHKNGHSVLEISTHLEELSDVKGSLARNGGVWRRFFNNSIFIPSTFRKTSLPISLKAALAKRTEMGIFGFNYQQERSLMFTDSGWQ